MQDTKNHYINNDDFHRAIVDYNKRKETNPTEKIPNQIGQYIILIATNLARAGNFSGYSYRDEMIGDAIEISLRYIHNYKPFENSLFPFEVYQNKQCPESSIQMISSYLKSNLIKRKTIEAMKKNHHSLIEFNHFLEMDADSIYFGYVFEKDNFDIRNITIKASIKTSEETIKSFIDNFFAYIVDFFTNPSVNLYIIYLPFSLSDSQRLQITSLAKTVGIVISVVDILINKKLSLFLVACRADNLLLVPNELFEVFHSTTVNKNIVLANNPHAYFTLICYRAFIRRIKREKIQHGIRRAIVDDLEMNDVILATFQKFDENPEFISQYKEFLKEHSDNYEHLYGNGEA